jgi:hypothetical protein
MDVVRAPVIVEGHPRANPLPRFPVTGESMEIDALVFERTPETLDVNGGAKTSQVAA